MQNEKEVFRLARILAKSLETELSPEERQILEEWLAESEYHRALYQQMTDQSFFSRKVQESADIDWEGDYRKFLKRFPGHSFSWPWRKWVGYAAVFVLPLALGIFLWWKQPRPEMPSLAGSIPVQSQPRPLLTIAQGRQIVLTDSLEMQEADGTWMAGKTGTLVYKPDTASQYSVKETPIYNCLEIPRGAEYFLALADGTKIWLNSETVIRYPVSFGGTAREVYIEGEAFFQVAKDSLHPFIVHSGAVQVEVLGTEFNVRHYPEEGQIATTLVEGSVQLRQSGTEKTVRLRPGQQGSITGENGGLEVREVDTYLYTAWKEGRFVFRRTRMEDLLNTLARWYDLTVFYQNEAAKDIRFTGDMTRMGDFRQVLHIIELNERVSFTIRERTIIVSLK